MKIKILLILALLLIPSAFAVLNTEVVAKEISVVAKDTNWSIVPGGNGIVSMNFQIPKFIYDQYKFTSQILTKNPQWITYENDYKNPMSFYEKLARNNNAVLDAITYQSVGVTVFGLKPNKDYTLIYYGYMAKDEMYSYVNDEWPWVTCITSFKTSSYGYAKSMGGRFNFISFLYDEIPEKFWVVTSSDVNCNPGMMTSWNPSDYLFELETV